MKTASLSLCGALMAVVIALPAPVMAQEEGALGSLFSIIGLTPRQREPIDYRERAPLVVPPKTELRQPQAGPSRNAAWPTDPDVVARQKEAEDRKLPIPLAETFSEQNPMMNPRGLRSGPRTASNAYRGVPEGAKLDNDATNLLIKPTMAMNAVDAERKQEAINNLRPGEEPDRRSLTEPPKGYRKATETVRAQADPIKRSDDRSENLGRQFVQEQAAQRQRN